MQLNPNTLAVFAGLLLPGACASSIKSVKTFEDPACADVSFGKIQVAGSYDQWANRERSKEKVAYLIEDAVDKVVSELNEDRLISR